ncbi:MAG: hypothetical protein GF370_01735 [Candidatus Nealsonbacteria bacterium]|nr:hypothetical protein [Candidatus Nealsonbacteria bacterium]
MVWVKIIRRIKEYIKGRKRIKNRRLEQKTEEISQRKVCLARFRGADFRIPNIEGFSEDVTTFLLYIFAGKGIPQKNLEYLDEDIKIVMRYRKAYREVEKILEKMSEIMGGAQEVEKFLLKKSSSSAALRLFKYVMEGKEEMGMRVFFNRAMSEIKKKRKKEKAQKTREMIDNFIKDFGYPSKEAKEFFEEIREDYPKLFDVKVARNKHKWKTVNDLEEELGTGRISEALKKTLETVFSRKDLSAEYKKEAAAVFKRFNVEEKYKDLIRKLGQ